MAPLHFQRSPVTASLTFFCLFLLFASHAARAQNSYPASGDAYISGLTIGMGSGSPGLGNTALGSYALHFNSNGAWNVAVGSGALSSNVGGTGGNAGSSNVAIGYNCMYFNTSGGNNTALGANALNGNTTGFNNTALGAVALLANNGAENVGVGIGTLAAKGSGNTNTALGNYALNQSTGNSNVAVGIRALVNTTSAGNLVAVGDSALLNNTASFNTAVGSKALMSTTTGGYNTALGFHSLYTNTTGIANAASGWQALYSNQTGSYNAAFGGGSLYNNTGNENTATGAYTLYYNTTGASNTAYGFEAMLNNTTGSYNTGIGQAAGPTSSSLSNTTSIGYLAATSASNSVAIGNSSVTSIGGYANWTNFSDGRFKKNINHNVPGLAFINKLAPVTYTLDIEGIEAMRRKGSSRRPDGVMSTGSSGSANEPGITQAMKEKAAVVYTGFVAQDVEKAALSVGYEFSGVDKPKDAQQSFYGLRYSDFVVPLVQAVQELSRKNDSLENALSQANTQLSQRLDQIEQLLGMKTSAAPLTSTLSSARLLQNVPNPVDQTTTINYYLPLTAGSSLIQVTGMNGEVIKSIALNGTGTGQLTLQTSQLAAGTYTYSLIVDGSIVDTKKMVVVR